MRITSKGQITIPVHVREDAGLMPNTDADFVRNGRGRYEVVPSKKRRKTKTRGERLIEEMKGGPRITTMTTDEIMKLTRG